MGRKHTTHHLAALADISKHLSAGVDIQFIRSRYSTIPKPTWYRLVASARKSLSQKGPFPVQEPIDLRQGSSAKPKGGGRGVQSKQRVGQSDALGRQGASTSESGPREDVSMSQYSSQGSATVVLRSFSGPKEYTTQRWVNPPKHEPNESLANLERLDDLFFRAEALMKASIKNTPAGYVIVNEAAYAKAIDLQRAILCDYVKSMEKLHSIEECQKFALAIVDALRDLPPETARRAIEIVKEAARPFASKRVRLAG